MITGLSPNSYENIQINAGIFVKNFDYSTITTPAALAAALQALKVAKSDKILGATRGGGTFTCRPTIREIEADGKRMAFVGSEINDGWDVRLNTTLLEPTPKNFQLALASADVASDNGVTTLTMRTDIETSDYLESLCWIGDILGGKFVIIDLKNALSISGASFAFRDKGEGTLPVEFRAHQDTVLDQDTAPVKVVFFETASDDDDSGEDDGN